MKLLKNTPFNLSIYGLVLAGTIYGEVQDQRMLVLICKPLLTIVLSSWFYFNSLRVGDRFTLLVQVGLFFSLIGDVALMFQHMDMFNFLIGLGAFLIAQLCYAIAFMQNATEPSPGRGPLVPLLITSLVVGYAFILSFWLFPNVDEAILPPVVIYACAITFMGIAAGFRFGRTFMRSFSMVLVGALLFIASDSLLASDRFVKPMDHASWSIMLTYGLAQLLIVSGCLAHVLDPEEIRRKATLST